MGMDFGHLKRLLKNCFDTQNVRKGAQLSLECEKYFTKGYNKSSRLRLGKIAKHKSLKTRSSKPFLDHDEGRGLDYSAVFSFVFLKI